jgi:mono/diheme cytochrome c family protein
MKRLVMFFAALGGLVFCAYQGLLYYDNNFKYGRMWETPAVRPLEDPPLPVYRGIVPLTGGEALLRAMPPEQLTFPIDKNRWEHIEKGKALYFTFCAQCHGENMDGSGTVGQSFHPLPTDLRGEKVQSLSEGVLFKDISYGVAEGRQPPLAGTIDVPERWLIIAYVKSLGTRN